MRASAKLRFWIGAILRQAAFKAWQRSRTVNSAVSEQAEAWARYCEQQR